MAQTEWQLLWTDINQCIYDFKGYYKSSLYVREVYQQINSSCFIYFSMENWPV